MTYLRVCGRSGHYGRLVRRLGAEVVTRRGCDLSAAGRSKISFAVADAVDTALVGTKVQGAHPVLCGVRCTPVSVFKHPRYTAALPLLSDRATKRELTPRVAKASRTADVGETHVRLEPGGLRARLLLRLDRLAFT